MRKIENKKDWNLFVRDLKKNVVEDEATFAVYRSDDGYGNMLFKAERYLPGGDYVTGRLTRSDEFDFREVTELGHTLGQTSDEFYDNLTKVYGRPFYVGATFGSNEESWIGETTYEKEKRLYRELMTKINEASDDINDFRKKADTVLFLSSATEEDLSSAIAKVAEIRNLTDSLKDVYNRFYQKSISH